MGYSNISVLFASVSFISMYLLCVPLCGPTSFFSNMLALHGNCYLTLLLQIMPISYTLLLIWALLFRYMMILLACMKTISGLLRIMIVSLTPHFIWLVSVFATI